MEHHIGQTAASWLHDATIRSFEHTLEHLQDAAMIMMATTGGWFSNLSDTTRNVLALLTVLTFGFTVGAMFVGFTTLPDKVQANYDKNVEIASNVEHLRDRVDSFDRDINYLVSLSTWTLCAIRVHDDPNTQHSAATLLQVCGAEPLASR